jgi:hypothetical protein
MGKTTLIGDVCAELRRQNWSCAIVDLSGVTGGGQLAERIADAWRRELGSTRKGKALWGKLTSRLRDSMELRAAGIGSMSRIRERESFAGQLGELLDLPRRISATLGGRSYVVFDEFQEVLASREALDGEIRARIQHHGTIASYCFAGSQASQLRQLFTDRKRPLYAQAEAVDVPLVDEPLMVEWLQRTFEDAGMPIDERTAIAVARAGAGHPQRTSLVANRLFESGSATLRDVEPAERAAYVSAQQELTQTWDGLSAADRVVLQLVAAGIPVSGNEAEQLTGRRRSTLSERRRALLDSAHLVDLGGRTRIIDPFLARFATE